MSKAASGGTDGSALSPIDAPAPGRFTAATVVAAVAAVVLVVGVVASALLIYRSAHLTDSPFSVANNGQPIVSDTDRHQAVAVAEQFCLRMDALDSSNPTAYTGRIAELLTTKEKTKFTGGFDQFQKLAQQSKLTGTGTVLASGVAAIDGDTASILVAHDGTVQSTAGTTQRHFRWLVSLRRVGSKWLVDDFTPVS